MYNTTYLLLEYSCAEHLNTGTQAIAYTNTSVTQKISKLHIGFLIWCDNLKITLSDLGHKTCNLLLILK